MASFNDYRALLVSGTEGWHDGSGTLTYNFLSTIPSYYYEYDGDYLVGGEWVPVETSAAMDAAQQAMMLQAVAAWNEVANVNMVVGSDDSADLNFGSIAFDDTGLFGFVEDFPDPDDLGGPASGAGDVWINSANSDQYIPGVGPVFGHTSWNTYLHELGHALGLRHPNESPNDAATNTQYTVMSYIPHPEEAWNSLTNQAFSLTGMVWDIQALQALYGANTETRNTDTVYLGDGGGNRGALEYQYAADHMMVQGEDGTYRNVILTIWDGGGQDLIDASDLTTDSRIDLRPGRYSSIGEIDNNIAVAAAVREGGQVVNYIEDAWGGFGNDQLIGNGTANELMGGDGRDRLVGRGGNDRLLGGDGNDQLRGGGGGDTLDGGAGNDLLVGQRGADIFVFSEGRDRLRGFADEDSLDLTGASGISDFADLIDNHAQNTRRGVRIEDEDGNRMVLLGQTLDDLDAGDFLF